SLQTDLLEQPSIVPGFPAPLLIMVELIKRIRPCPKAAPNTVIMPHNALLLARHCLALAYPRRHRKRPGLKSDPWAPRQDSTLLGAPHCAGLWLCGDSQPH